MKDTLFRTPSSNTPPEINWTCSTSIDDALTLKGGETGIVFRETFISQIQKLNPFMSPDLTGELIKRMEAIPPTIEGNLLAWEYLKGLKQVFVPDEKRERDVRFMDIQDIANNTFHVTDEFSFTNGRKTIRGMSFSSSTAFLSL
jgi:type I restriction enzyme, R subunit